MCPYPRHRHDTKDPVQFGNTLISGLILIGIRESCESGCCKWGSLLQLLYGGIQGGFLLCEFTHGNEMGSGRGIYLLIYQAWGITSVAYYFLFSQCPPPLPSTGGISKCVLTAEVTLSRPLDLGAVCLHLPQYL